MSADSVAPARRRYLTVSGRSAQARSVALLRVGVPLGGLACWAASLASVRSVTSTALWPATSLPLLWYVAAALVVGGAVTHVCTAERQSWVSFALLAAVVLVLYGTIPAVSEAPQYAWTYKHIGVTRSIIAHGTVASNGDIYDRWPGFFALVAAFSRVTGVDPMSLASWFEPVFTFLDALIIASIASSLSGRRRVGLLSALFWLFANWLGQDYFSPQGFAYTLSLVVMMVVLKQLSPHGQASGRFVEMFKKWLGPAKVDSAPRARTLMPLAIVFAVYLPVVASHQLTPYMTVAQLAVLTLLGLRPRWLFLTLLGIAVAYLLPNFGYMAKHYGILASLNPANNVQLSTGASVHPPWLADHVGELLTFATVTLAAWGGVRLRRLGDGRRVVTLAGLVAAPFLFLLGNDYGGEGILRVILFSSPWLAILGAWGVCSLRGTLRPAIGLVSAATLCGLFTVAFAGFASANVIPRPEVQATAYFYSHARPGSVLMLAGDNYPNDLAADYRTFAGEVGDSSPNLLADPKLRGHVLGTADIPEVLSYVRTYSSRGYLVFSKSQYTYAEFFHSVPAGSLQGLQRAVAGSRDFTLWFSNADARIYRIISPPRRSSGRSQ
jgi:hypothetical protein